MVTTRSQSARKPTRTAAPAKRRSSRKPAAAKPSRKSRSKSPARRSKSPAKRTQPAKAAAETGNNWVDGGLGDGTIMVPFLLVFCPIFAQLMAFVTTSQAKEALDATAGLSGFWAACNGAWGACGQKMADAALSSAPTAEACMFLVMFMGLALVLDVVLPGKTEYGPLTLTGHRPEYKDNGLKHCFVFSLLFIGGSDLGLGLYPLGIMYEQFAPCISALNVFGMALAAFLYYKGLHFPSTKDCGSSGSLLKDFTWGTELYPRVCGVDIKRFVNCRFSMTFWQLAGISFVAKSLELRPEAGIDPGILLCALSQYLYLVKFYIWEIGYMRSIDIIVDRAGWEIQWGCLVWVPAVYTLHSRFLVQHPSGLSIEIALAIFVMGMSGVAMNYWADDQRRRFRESGGEKLVWGQRPVFVKTQYTTINSEGEEESRSSLLLASGFWGIARHFHYVFELVAAYSWCLLANPFRNGP